MSMIDPFDEMRRTIRKMKDIIREFERELEELEERDLERLTEEKWTELSSHVMEPLYTVIDKGDKVLIIIEVPEAEEGSTQITILEDSIMVEGRVDNQKVRRALGDRYWMRSSARVRGAYRLPFKLVPEEAKIERKGGKIFIWVPKLKKA